MSSSPAQQAVPPVLSCHFYRGTTVTPKMCRDLTSKPVRNLDGCVGSKCPSPFRICCVCSTQGTSELVWDFVTGRCKFHAKHGPHVRISDVPQTSDESTDPAPLACRSSAEVINGVDSHVAAANRFEQLDAYMRRAQPDEPEYAPSFPVPESKQKPKPNRRETQKTKHWNNNLGMVKVTDLETGQKIRRPALEVLETMHMLHDTHHMPWDRIPHKLGIGPATFDNLRHLDKLIPAVRKLLAVERKPHKRLGYTHGARIAHLAPSRQRKVALQFLSGRLSTEDLNDLARSRRRGAS